MPMSTLADVDSLLDNNSNQISAGSSSNDSSPLSNSFCLNQSSILNSSSNNSNHFLLKILINCLLFFCFVSLVIKQNKFFFLQLQ
jgi:hypothetical protein